MAAPIGGEHLNGPAELTGSAADGAIGAAGAAMEQPMDELAPGAGHQGSGDLLGRPEQIAATTGHHDLPSTDGAQRGEHSSRQQRNNRTGAQCSGLRHHRRV